MDDSDEYFDDTFVLDEHALARIEEIETIFISTQKSTQDVSHSFNNATHQTASTVSHKSTIFTESKKDKPPVVSRAADPFENDTFDLDVRVGPNGTYVFAGGSNERAGFNGQKSVPVDGDQAGSITGVRAGKKDFEVELADLHAQLAKLKESNGLMLQSLREAQEAQLTKAGEVAILRSTVEKQKQEYSDMVSKAKAERIAFEKSKSELQAKIKEETDRLSTNFAFRLQELQTSARKQIRSSAQSLRTARNTLYDGTETPSRAPRRFNPSLARENVDNDSDQEAPSSSPSRLLSNRRRALEKKPQFKGFQNAFTQSAPVVKSPVKNVHNPPMSSAGGSKILDQDTFIQNDDSMLVDRENGVFESPVREFATELPADSPSAEVRTSPLEEFQRTIFSHVAPDSDDLTLHSLFSVSFSATDITSDLAQVYASACNLLLKCCTVPVTSHHPHPQRSWENSAGKIAGIFVTLGTTLFHAKILDRLLALLDLLLQLTLIIPSISIHFLRPTTNPLLEDFPEFEQGNLMTLFCDIIRTHLVPSSDSRPFGKRHLTHALHHNLTMTILNLLASLYWHGAEGDLKMNFSIIFKSGALQTLLLASQGQVVIKRTLQLLILWASDERLIDLFQSQEEASMSGSQSEAVIVSIMNQISAFLTDIVDPQLYDLLHLTFTLINTLGYTRRDNRSSLLESLYLLPSVIICITTLTRGLYEEKPEIISNVEVAESAVNLLFTAVSSLHHLLFFPETYSNFSLQLMKSTGISRKFNGVVHMFIVSFGRLSWAGMPECLPPKARSLCEAISELSMELIETVVPGPECDSLWSVWHESDEMED